MNIEIGLSTGYWREFLSAHYSGCSRVHRMSWWVFSVTFWLDRPYKARAHPNYSELFDHDE